MTVAQGEVRMSLNRKDRNLPVSRHPA